MTWFKIDDGWWRSRKLGRISKRRKVSVPLRVAAAGAWALCGDWSADQLSDGFVPAEQLEEWDPTGVLTDALVSAGFWTRHDDPDGGPGVRFHGWDEWQPTREHVETKRAQVRDRVRKHRAAKRESTGSDDECREVSTDPTGEYSPNGQGVTGGSLAASGPGMQSESAGHRDSAAAGNAVGNALQDALVTLPPTRPDPTRISAGHPERGSSSAVGAREAGDEPAPRGPDVFAQRAHSTAAYRLVNAWAKTCRRRPPASVLTQLGIEVDALLVEDWPQADIAAALAALGAKGLGPKLLASVANELANSGARDRNPYTVPADQLTPEDVEVLIGREPLPEPPIEIVESGDRDERRQWYATAMAAWHAERHDRAVAVRSRRLANVADLDERRRSG